MRAVVLHEYGGPEKLKFEDNFPEPQVSGGTVLIAAAAASVNPIDWKLRSGARQKDSPLSFPAILGRDVSGVVRAVGANVKHFRPGDRVLALSWATYAELVAVDDSDVTHLPDGVDLADAAAIPLIALTGDQLVRLATNVKKGQVVLITGALGSVGRAAVHTAKKIGAQVIAGVRGNELDDARSLGVSDALAIDDDEAIEKFRLVDAIADTVGGEVAAKLIAKVSQGGSFGYTAVLPQSAAAQNPAVKIARVSTQPDPSKVREFADDVRDGKFVLPIGRRMPLRDAAEAHVLGEKGGIGKILLLAPDSQDSCLQLRAAHHRQRTRPICSEETQSMDRISSFPIQDFDGMIAEVWQTLNVCLYHAAYVRVYADTGAMRLAGSKRAHAATQTLSQAERELLQEDAIVFRAHFAGVLWQLRHLVELLGKAYKHCDQESIVTAEQRGTLAKALKDDPIVEEIREYRNLSHQFSGVVITIHDASDAFIAHVFPPMDARAPEQRAPLDEVEIQKAVQERELNMKLESYCNHLGGYCEGLFMIIDAKHKTAVIPRSHGFLVTVPHSYQGKLPDGANGVIYVKAVGSAQ